MGKPMIDEMPERIYVTCIDAKTRELLAQKKAGDLDTEYVRADLPIYGPAPTLVIYRLTAQRDRLAEALRRVDLLQDAPGAVDTIKRFARAALAEAGDGDG